MKVLKLVNNIYPPIMKRFFDFRKTDTTLENYKKWDSKNNPAK